MFNKLIHGENKGAAIGAPLHYKSINEVGSADEMYLVPTKNVVCGH